MYALLKMNNRYLKLAEFFKDNDVKKTEAMETIDRELDHNVYRCIPAERLKLLSEELLLMEPNEGTRCFMSKKRTRPAAAARETPMEVDLYVTKDVHDAAMLNVQDRLTHIGTILENTLASPNAAPSSEKNTYSCNNGGLRKLFNLH